MKELAYITRARVDAQSMTNEELFDEMLSWVGNEANDQAGERDSNYRNLYESLCRERLKDWLEVK